MSPMRRTIFTSLVAVGLAGCVSPTGVPAECRQVGGCNPPPIVFVGNGGILIRFIR